MRSIDGQSVLNNPLYCCSFCSQLSSLLRTGLLLPVLGALPDSLIIVVSGLGGSREEANEQVSRAGHHAMIKLSSPPWNTVHHWDLACIVLPAARITWTSNS